MPQIEGEQPKKSALKEAPAHSALKKSTVVPPSSSEPFTTSSQQEPPTNTIDSDHDEDEEVRIFIYYAFSWRIQPKTMFFFPFKLALCRLQRAQIWVKYIHLHDHTQKCRAKKAKTSKGILLQQRERIYFVCVIFFYNSFDQKTAQVIDFNHFNGINADHNIYFMIHHGHCRRLCLFFFFLFFFFLFLFTNTSYMCYHLVEYGQLKDTKIRIQIGQYFQLQSAYLGKFNINILHTSRTKSAR
eukprot:TRINITY_DN6385_c0_g1_i12.p1 TRINITY_DN6385_c0_g1~~TRINITY_DN6385_c0_g1_i12.p1  ORF type:complete len:242 (-),score=29.67 TRINITY_DN6385_c0_g1_i12:255-980(-)